MSFCTRPIVAANRAVVAPMTMTTVCAAGAASKSGDSRATMKTPAVTMVAAWMSAETGVGPPGVEQELGRLAHRAHEEEQAGERQRVPLDAEEPEGAVRELADARED